MRRLLLLRHGKADRHSAGGDRERPLTRRGLEDSRLIGAFLAGEGVTPDLAVASNARRAKQTLEKVLEAFPGHVTHLIENSIYLASVDHLLDTLRQAPEKISTLLVVGHNPGFAELACALAGTGARENLARMQAKFPTGALAILDFSAGGWADIDMGAANLHRFVTPAELRGGEEDPD
ncbi:SixA phosphatase family protein [Methylocystis heyeri]|uniref:Histidine phosphatase family protein n=1 Tax=Methylocystis heyeri TaxID=391905 RepID=A0A6B8K921_9HYPH|nr:histidine phosphatase family protein [Methylocystis heyeri]QGM44566.1 histidine phosphatase family protein [Methylocystis heyeri]